MTPPMIHKLPAVIALGFAAWIVWLWVMPMPVEKQQRVKPVEQRQSEQVHEQEQPAVPLALVLPQPPAPKPVVKAPALKPVEVVQPVQPIEEPIEKPAPVEKKPEPVKALTPEPVKQNPKPKLQPKPQQATMAEPVKNVTPVEAANGRALLRVLEFGKGPQIEIAWPREAGARDQLYRTFKGCYGMENAVMDRQGNLFRVTDDRGQRWEINMDRYSGFIRQAAGHLPGAEQRLERAILHHHGRLVDPLVVRVFPRAVDASLLGGLKAVVGEGYMKADSIQARYAFRTGKVVVDEIRLNAQPVEGVIALRPLRRCSGRV